MMLNESLRNELVLLREELEPAISRMKLLQALIDVNLKQIAKRNEQKRKNDGN